MPEEKKNMPTVDDQYQRLIKARNFHYDNLNKWLITFYAIIGALFLALHTLHADEHLHRYMELCIAIVGYVVSIAAFLSGKGYYYWETNWILLVHHFEKTYLKDLVKEYGDDMKVYSVFANKSVNENIATLSDGANISTSKVALAVTAFITWLWGTIVIYMCINLLPDSYSEFDIWIRILVSLSVSAVLTCGLVRLGGVFFQSNMKPLDDLCITDNNEDIPIKLDKKQ